MNSKRAELQIEFQQKLINGEIWQTCLNCIYWTNPKIDKLEGSLAQGCTLFKAMPPPHIIVSGCKDHENDIPF